MFPAPPRPLLNLEADCGSPASKSEAGPRALAPEVVFGALKVFPAPPRPAWMNLLAVGWGSVTEYRDGILDVWLVCFGEMVVSDLICMTIKRRLCG